MDSPKTRRSRRILSRCAGACLVIAIGAWLLWPSQSRAVRVEQVMSLPAHSDPLVVADFNPRTSLLAVGDLKHNRRVPSKIVLWDISRSPRRVCRLDGPEMQCRALSFSPDGSVLAIGGQDGVVRIADPHNGVILQSLQTVGNIPSSSGLAIDTRRVRTLAFSPDGQVLAVGTGRGRIEIWSTSRWGRLKTLRKHPEEINDLAFSSDGARLVSVGGRWETIEGTFTSKRRPEVFEWSTADWTRVREIPVNSLASFATRIRFAGEDLAAIGDQGGNLSVIHFQSGDLVTSLRGHENAIADLAFDEQRNLLISASAERTIIWDMENYGQAGALQGAVFVVSDSQRGLIATSPAKTAKSCVLFRLEVAADTP